MRELEEVILGSSKRDFGRKFMRYRVYVGESWQTLLGAIHVEDPYAKPSMEVMRQITITGSHTHTLGLVELFSQLKIGLV